MKKSISISEFYPKRMYIVRPSSPDVRSYTKFVGGTYPHFMKYYHRNRRPVKTK